MNEKAKILELMGIRAKRGKLPFTKLSKHFLKDNKHWSKSTYPLNESILSLHIAGKPLPANPTSRSVYVRRINQCWRWGLKHNLVNKPEMLSCPKIGEARHRTYTPSELEKMFTIIQPIDFNRIIRLEYYTCARNGEIRSYHQITYWSGLCSFW